MNKFLLFFLIFFVSAGLWSQDDHFQIEFESFAPNANLMIQMMEDNPAEPFKGVATDGTDLSFHNMIGTPMLFWFWDVKDEMSVGQIDGLNLMNQLFGEKVHFIGFCYDKKPFVDELLLRKQVDFPVLPYAFKLGELHYGSELGQGRVFLIDSQGIIKKAIPRQFFIDNQNSFSQLRNFISELANGDH